MNDYLVDNEYLSIRMVESVRRAELVAQEIDKRVLVISAYPKLYNDRPNIIARKPCLCGRFGRGDVGNEPCSCSVQQVAKWYQDLRKHYADALWVEDIFTWRRITIKNVDESGKMLLRQAITQFGCVGELTKIMSIAQAVAMMSKQKTIQPEHIAEALSYRTKY